MNESDPNPNRKLALTSDVDAETVVGTDEAGDTYAALDSILRQIPSTSDERFVDEDACRKVVERIQQMRGPERKKSESDDSILETIDEYELLEQIGKGGMGDVYRARHRRLNREVAIKLLKPEFSANQFAAERFEREMKAVGSVEHANIVKAVDAGKDDGTHFLAMEYISVLSCAELLKRTGPLPIHEA